MTDELVAADWGNQVRQTLAACQLSDLAREMKRLSRLIRQMDGEQLQRAVLGGTDPGQHSDRLDCLVGPERFEDALCLKVLGEVDTLGVRLLDLRQRLLQLIHEQSPFSP
jgi:hypothetical protein